jgi:ATP-dependent Clp protease ATP-binding subunit ClpA
LAQDEATPFDVNKDPNEKEQEKSKTPTLDFFCEDLTAQAREGKIDKVI